MTRRLLVALSAIVLSASCGSGREPAPRLVILYATCTLNKQLLSPYTPALRTTPNLQAFARESVVFARHTSECGQSGVDFATLFTGTQADGHGVYFHPVELDGANQTLAESFAAAGYETWFWSGQPMASAELGYGQGVAADHVVVRELSFSKRPHPLEPDALAKLTGNDPEFVQLLARLRDEPESRAFVQLHFTITHEPYHQCAPLEQVAAFLEQFPEAAPGVTRAQLERWLPVYERRRYELSWDFAGLQQSLALSPEEVAEFTRTIEAVYAAGVHQLDGFFGRFLASIREHGLEDEALVAFTADHGEALFRPGTRIHFTHGLELVPEVLDVPWFLRVPGLAPATYSAVTRSIDVFPTLLGACGIAPPASVQGIDLMPALRGTAAPPAQRAFSHTALWDEHRIRRFAEFPLLQKLLPSVDPEHMSVRVRDGDLVLKLENQLDGSFAFAAFDLAQDPREEDDLYDAQNDLHRRLAAELERYKARLIEGFRRSRSLGREEQDALERLRDIGYVR